jgi:glycosyltransferase involved in cell wall biosynthesis
MPASSTDIPSPHDSNTETAPFVSVVIPTYNRSQMLCNCVDSILASTFTDFEIIIVDDASTDNTEEIVHSRYLGVHPNVRYHRNPVNLMSDKSRNVAIRMARAPWFLFLDSDNLILPDMLEQFVACTKAHPELGLIVALSWNAFNQSVFTLGGDINWWTGRAADHHLELYRGKRFALEDLDRAGFTDWYPTVASSPNALFAKREAVEKAGDWNPHYGLYFDDPDFCLRITRGGFKAAVCTRARTRHLCFVGTDPPLLRRLGIGNPRSSFLMARNRSWFMKNFAPWWGKTSYFLFFVHALCIYYIFLTLFHRRPDCAWAFFKGTWTGILSSPPPYPPPGWRLGGETSTPHS